MDFLHNFHPKYVQSLGRGIGLKFRFPHEMKSENLVVRRRQLTSQPTNIGENHLTSKTNIALIFHIMSVDSDGHVDSQVTRHAFF